MGVRLSEEEIWAVVAAAPTGIVTTLRRDGWPVALPVWFVALEREIYLRTAETSRKVARIRNDRRASFLVESGEHWSELRAISMSAQASIEEDPARRERALAALAEKYRGRRVSRTDLPEATVRHYGSGGSVVVRLAPLGPVISWDNSRVRTRTP